MSDPAIPPEIKAQSTERLLTLFAQLTHKIHSAQLVQRGERDGSVDVAMKTETNLREQGSIVKRTIMIRCGEVPR